MDDWWHLHFNFHYWTKAKKFNFLNYKIIHRKDFFFQQQRRIFSVGWWWWWWWYWNLCKLIVWLIEMSSSVFCRMLIKWRLPNKIAVLCISSSVRAAINSHLNTLQWTYSIRLCVRMWKKGNEKRRQESMWWYYFIAYNI